MKENLPLIWEMTSYLRLKNKKVKGVKKKYLTPFFYCAILSKVRKSAQCKITG